ncbi:hypothetical protein HED55_22850 [Ochrobactrum haematophilum]|uniref:Outer membrane autotransporter n=1 Tax=Brucella haematophila TaxID=419474 RepID=A0ABX1DPV8_9HYPH|nr:hypothetical protein [Brucella haematophila]
MVAGANQPIIGTGVTALVDKLYLDQGNILTVSNGGSLVATDLISIGRQNSISSTSFMRVVSGGSVETDRLFIGDGINEGSVLVDGTGSTLTVNLSTTSSRMVVGAWGDGELTVANGGVLSVGAQASLNWAMATLDWPPVYCALVIPV